MSKVEEPAGVEQPPVDGDKAAATASAPVEAAASAPVEAVEPKGIDKEAAKKHFGDLMDDLIGNVTGGRRRSKRRRQKKPSKKSKKGGRSRKNSSKNRRKHSRRR